MIHNCWEDAEDDEDADVEARGEAGVVINAVAEDLFLTY